MAWRLSIEFGKCARWTSCKGARYVLSSSGLDNERQKEFDADERQLEHQDLTFLSVIAFPSVFTTVSTR